MTIARPETKQCWVKARTPEGAVVPEDFRLEEQAIPALNDGEFLIRTHYLSVAPVMRRYMIDGAGIEKPLEAGDTIHGRGVGGVIESRNDAWPVGTMLQGKLGWQTHTISDGAPDKLMYPIKQTMAPISTGLGILGMTGFTAYCSIKDIGAPKPGETMLVSGAMGGVGSITVQVASAMGCRVIGIAGSVEKCRILTDELGCEAAINYREGDLAEQIANVIPQGIDIFFDNVGGPTLDAALMHLNKYARIICCGRISEYLGDKPYPLANWAQVGKCRARMQGFFVYDYAPMFAEAEEVMAGWVSEGKLTWKEDILEGFERMPEALMRLYDGSNIGKQIVKVI